MVKVAVSAFTRGTLRHTGGGASEGEAGSTQCAFEADARKRLVELVGMSSGTLVKALRRAVHIWDVTPGGDRECSALCNDNGYNDTLHVTSRICTLSVDHDNPRAVGTTGKHEVLEMHTEASGAVVVAKGEMDVEYLTAVMEYTYRIKKYKCRPASCVDALEAAAVSHPSQ
ncbi:hypothetical protein HaLaN_01300 [Haematococcus lacustris]|uniref:Uncharacterized protein n=1 Tax=Haematococcus lacustris TaxID=44745 RepID=A0A699YBD9_HAELA|nr:hypothetical protein HaLaN_01300 [Haematococcus lacustris]